LSDKHPALKFIAFGILCALCAAWLAQQTGNLRLLASTHSYTAVLDDVSGLVADDSVLLSGVRVGEVESIEIERGKALVTFGVDKDIQLRDSWEVGARWRNVTGQRYFYLYPTGDGDVLQPGAQIPNEQSRSVADIGLFLERLTPLLRAINPEQQNKVVAALNTALDGKEERTQQLVRDLGSLTNTLADSDDELERVLVQGDALLSSYNERKESIRAFFTDFADVSSTLARRDEQLLGALGDISDVQAELASLIERNDADIADVVSQLEFITGTVTDNRQDFERAIATARDGLAVYMLISRWGQWFNVRIVAASVQDHGQIIVCRTEANGPCGEPNEANPSGGDQTSMGEPAAQPVYTRAPARLNGVATVMGTALGDRPGAGLVYARDRMISAAPSPEGGVR
jgi:phospholipid/cholesterol/gamma-HCH transport system substrate-binding protein